MNPKTKAIAELTGTLLSLVITIGLATSAVLLPFVLWKLL